MSTITIRLADDIHQLAVQQAQAAQLTVGEFLEGLVVDAVARAQGHAFDPSLSEADIEDIRLGLDDIKRGRTVTLADALAERVARG